MINCHILKTMYMKEGIMSIEINRRLHEALGRCWHEVMKKWGQIAVKEIAGKVQGNPGTYFIGSALASRFVFSALPLLDPK